MTKRCVTTDPPQYKEVYYLCTAHLMSIEMIRKGFDTDESANPQLFGINCMEDIEYSEVDEDSCDSDEVDFVLKFTYDTETKLAQLIILATDIVGQYLRSEYGESSTFEIEREVFPVTDSKVFHAE